MITAKVVKVCRPGGWPSVRYFNRSCGGDVTSLLQTVSQSSAVGKTKECKIKKTWVSLLRILTIWPAGTQPLGVEG